MTAIETEAHQARATRYAEALAAAAASDERIAALTEQLAEHEWHRTQAESTLNLVEYDAQIGKVWQQTEDEPGPDEVSALLCLTSGEVWQRYSGHGGGWVRASLSERAQTINMWPIQDSGPFIAWRDDYGFAQTVRKSRLLDEEQDQLHAQMRECPGYRGEGASSWGRPSLPAALGRVLMHKNRQVAELTEALRALRARIAALGADDTQQWGDGEEQREVAVIDLAKVHAVLDEVTS